MNSLMARAQVPANLPAGDSAWYYVVSAGYSYVDEACNSYIRALYDLDRDRDQIVSGLVLADKATSAVLGVTGASTKAIQIVAQAFGLATGGTNVFVNRYLFKVEPAIVFLTLDKMRDSFRAGVAKYSDSIRSPGQAMVVLRKYLLLCQPASIEAVINQYVAVAEAEVTVTREGLGLPSQTPTGMRSGARALSTREFHDAGSIGIRLRDGRAVR
jgi:hypothetical protein